MNASELSLKVNEFAFLSGLSGILCGFCLLLIVILVISNVKA